MTIAPSARPQKSVGQIYCVAALMSEIHPPLPVENNTCENVGHATVPACCDCLKLDTCLWKGGGK